MKTKVYSPEDQYARFEAAKAYLDAALQIMEEATLDERSNEGGFSILHNIRFAKVSIENSLGTVGLLLAPLLLEEGTQPRLTELDEPSTPVLHLITEIQKKSA